MRIIKNRVVAFDARYINDRYHGIGRYAYNLLDALSRCDEQSLYLVFYHPDYPNTRFSLAKLAARPNIRLRPIRLPLYLPGEQFVWPFLLARDRVQIFHSPYVVVPVLAPVRSIMTIHDLILERYPEYRPRSSLQKFYQPVTRICLSRASLICTPSKATYSDIQAYYSARQADIQVTGSAVDPIFKRETDPRRLAEVRARYALPKHFILTVGAGRPHKNVVLLVEAFARLDPSLDMHLVVGGEHDSRFPDNVSACINAHGLASRVLQIGMIHEADLPAVYSLADVFVFPSLIEGFGLPPLEAMACGTPVLAATTPAVCEVVGEAALTFDAHDPEQLATLLESVLQKQALRTALSQLGTERVRLFTWERVARSTLEAYAKFENGDRSLCWECGE